MARDLIKFSNDKKGFLTLLVIEGLLAVWAVAAMITSARVGSRRSVVYSMICLFGIFYIFGRSLRNYVNIVKKEEAEKEQKTQGEQHE